MKSSKACKREIKSVMNTAGNVSLCFCIFFWGGVWSGGACLYALILPLCSYELQAVDYCYMGFVWVQTPMPILPIN